MGAAFFHTRTVIVGAVARVETDGLKAVERIFGTVAVLFVG